MLPVVSLVFFVRPQDLTLQMFLVCLDSASTLNLNQPLACLLRAHLSLPKFGMGSSNCAGSENLTFAMSVTPINLLRDSGQPRLILRYVHLFEIWSGCLGVQSRTFSGG